MREQKNSFNLTILTSDRFVGKRFDLVEGKIVKTSKPAMTSGDAYAVAAPDAATLAAVIDNLGTGQNLCLGVMSNGREAARVIPKAKVKETQESTIARSQDFLTHPIGPGWLLIDFDNDQMPVAVSQRIEELGGVERALRHIWPELSKAEMLTRPSSSGGIYTEGIEPKAASGLHVYVLIDNPSDSPAILEALQRRAWAEGLGWIKLSKSGVPLVRSIVDASVGKPERIVFEAPPVLGEGVKRIPPTIAVQKGMILTGPTDSPDVTAAIEGAKEALRQKAETVKEAWTGAQVQRVMTCRKVDRADAEKIVRAMSEGGVLDDDALIYDSRGRVVAVRDLLESVQRGCKISLPDPEEGPEYGMTTASILWGVEYREPILLSHAHGAQRKWRFRRFYTRESEIRDIAPIAPPKRDLKALQKVLRGIEGEGDLAKVLGVAIAASNRIPSQWSEDDLRAFLSENMPEGALPGAWVDAILARVRKSLHRRREAALKSTRFTPGTLATVDHTPVRELAALRDLEGVTVIRAPMASGKTQKIGRPWVDAVKAGGADVWAIAHRQALIGELAQRLGLADYREPAVYQAVLNKGGLAICLPSITLTDWRFEEPQFVFIDEIRQVLEFLGAQYHCRTRDGTAKDVFDRLVTIVKEARGVLCADAGADDTVIEFLRHCRPTDRIRVIEMEDKSLPIEAEFMAGSRKTAAAAVDAAAFELMIGGKVWIACESKGFAHDAAKYLSDETGARVLVLTADEKFEPEAARFFEKPEDVSREYDAVIASPVISSGLSIEHKDKPHFDLVVGIFSGAAVRPSAAAQMLRRVRYARRFVIACEVNNRVAGWAAETILDGREAAARAEGFERFRGRFDELVAGFRAEGENERADFAAGLWWQLEAAGWQMTRRGLDDDEEPEAGQGLKSLSDQRAKARVAALIEACDRLPFLTHADVDQIKRAQPNTVQRVTLEAWRITEGLGVAKLGEDDVAFVDRGGLAAMDLFEDLKAMGQDLPELDGDEQRAALMHRRLRNARRKHLGEIFEGYDIWSDAFWLTREAAETIVSRIRYKAPEYAASGAIPPRYGRRYGGKQVPLPQNPIRAVQEILARAALRTVETQRRVSRDTPKSLNSDVPSRDRERAFRLDSDVSGRMAQRVKDRAEMRAQIAKSERGMMHPAHIEEAKHLTEKRNRCADGVEPAAFTCVYGTVPADQVGPWNYAGVAFALRAAEIPLAGVITEKLMALRF